MSSAAQADESRTRREIDSALDSVPLGAPRQRSSADLADASGDRAYDCGIVAPSRSSEGEHVRVLLVEDGPLVSEAIAKLFDREPGFTLRRAGSLAEARQMLAGVDIAILDLGLPDGKGADLIPELHRLNLAAKAVVLTSSIDPRDAEEAIRRGALLVLNKLADLDEITQAVRRIQQPESS
jgi:CheY-like chemotaxis protein